MMKMKKLSILLLISALTVHIPAGSQTTPAGSDRFSLLTMPFNQRPLNLYKGQLQLNAGYKFAVMSRQFDSDGDLVILKDIGIASVYHYYMLELKYGVTRFLDISASTDYLKRGIRSQSVTYMSTAEIISVNNLEEEKGMGDILLLASLRPPMEYRWFDLAIGGGIYLPSAKYEPEKPDHNITDVVSSTAFTVNYHYRNRIGYGVPVLLFSPSAKLTWSKLSVEASLVLRDPVKEGENIRWNETLTASRTFNYSSSPYKYLLNRTTDICASVHYQAAGWFDLEIGIDWFRSAGGWTEYWGNKYRNPARSIFTIEPSFEIQISPSLRIWQTAGFPVKGENSYAPFFLFTTVSYNLIPF